MRASQVHHLQSSYPLQLHAIEPPAGIQRVKQFFQGTTLPSPTEEVRAAWMEVPNHVFPTSRTEMVFLEGPPPTPTQGVIVKDDSSCVESIPYNRSQYDGSLRRDDIESSTCDEGLHPNQEKSENPLRPVTLRDHSHSLTRRNSPSRREFCMLVDQWRSDYQARGTQPFVDTLLASGINSPDAATLASRLAHSIIKEVRKASKLEGDNLRTTIRFSALALFRRHWERNGVCHEVSSTVTNDTSLTQRGINIAGIVGALFGAEILSAEDIYLCLMMLLEGSKHVDRLRAMHALLDHANDKLCKKRNLATLMEFKASIATKGESGEFVWATSPHSKAIIDSILATIQQWMALQTMKRGQQH